MVVGGDNVSRPSQTKVAWDVQASPLQWLAEQIRE